LPPIAYATDDHVGVWYEGIEPTLVVSDTSVDVRSGPGAYRVELKDGDVVETRYGVGQRFD